MKHKMIMLCSSECEDLERFMGDLSLPLLRHLHPSLCLFRFCLSHYRYHNWHDLLLSAFLYFDHHLPFATFTKLFWS